ncbi:DUF2752 domain-containing protein [Filimonas effusa]|uniref:DUF2752 domain-containing protein n=1 Tax=Filimonas effusa TaxID=2508721 RepID=A0A4Q1DBG9_9BACT|nr:DUF2752 domain-containing protein [Filimonas effusa]RXK86782.1 DUF2752 domain-containing protein [Filimonas effusa]
MEKEGYLSGNKLLFILWLLVPVLLFQVDHCSGNGHFTLCLFKNITGRDCYGCGVLRGISACLHLDFPAAYQLNRLNLLTIPLLTFLYVKELWKTRPGLLRRR